MYAIRRPTPVIDKKLSDIIGTLSVVLGLVFVGFQIRQNTDAARSATVQAVAEMSMQNIALLVESAELRQAYSIVRNNSDALSDEQMELVHWYTVHAMRIMENRFRQFELGVLVDATAVGGNGGLYRTYWFRTWWESNQGQWAGSAFHDFVANDVLPNAATQPSSPSDSDDPTT